MKIYRLLLFLLMLMLASCGSNTEVARIMSPSGEIEAILFEKNGGATTSFLYNIYLAQASEPERLIHIAQLHGATRSDSAYGINLVWLSHNELELRYYKADGVKYLESNVKIGNTIYHISQKPGLLDNTAPPGGMMYNKQGRPYG